MAHLLGKTSGEKWVEVFSVEPHEAFQVLPLIDVSLILLLGQLGEVLRLDGMTLETIRELMNDEAPEMMPNHAEVQHSTGHASLGCSNSPLPHVLDSSETTAATVRTHQSCSCSNFNMEKKNPTVITFAISGNWSAEIGKLQNIRRQQSRLWPQLTDLGVGLRKPKE